MEADLHNFLDDIEDEEYTDSELSPFEYYRSNYQKPRKPLEKPKVLTLDNYVFKDGCLYLLLKENATVWEGTKRLSKSRRLIKLTSLLKKPIRSCTVNKEQVFEISDLSVKEKDYILTFIKNNWSIKV